MQVKSRLWSRKVKLLEQFGPARITNVPPLSAKIARALYSEAEDDAEGIERFMAAQAGAGALSPQLVTCGGQPFCYVYGVDDAKTQ